MPERQLRKKYSFTAHGKHLVLIKRPFESEEHVLCKAVAFALYLPDYPGLMVEVKVGHRYKPDLVQLDRYGRPEFWGECGVVGKHKLVNLLKKFRNTRFAFMKWGDPPHQFTEMVEEAVRGKKRNAPVDIVRVPGDVAGHASETGDIDIGFGDCEVYKVG
ncbi:MAG: hypothetical protein GF392_04285 [Candidatus Omnitrophica bacterium]|nr:hypothetical protein [Candidatus Omnitrophota bacterium]